MDQPSREEVQEGEESGVEDHWYLVDAHGQKFRLPKTMLFLGREECDVVVASQSVDKRHAVLTFDIYLNRFKVKDLSTTHGTYVNNRPIQEQEYVTLNHMDSVRLGNDTMMYHIEQGSQITSQGGHLPDHRVIPSWATRRAHHEAPAIHVHTHTMAECQGCIAEQSIEHSCGLHTEKPTTDSVLVNDPNHCMYRGNQPTPPPINQNNQQPYNQPPPQCHHCQHHHHHNLQQYQQPHPYPPPHQPSYPPPESQLDQGHSVSSQSPNPNSVDIHHQLQQHHQQHYQDYSDHPQHQEIARPEDSSYYSQEGEKQSDTDSGPKDIEFENNIENNGSAGPGRNTWPRKRARQAPHVATLFQQSETADDSSTNGSEAKPAGPMSGMYFVSFDDSVCNGSTSDLNAAAVNAQRISRKSPFSKADLNTVKKGTPLYGQPDWWGESEQETENGDSGQATNVRSAKQEPGSANQEGRRPSSLVLTPEEKKHSPQLVRMVSRGSTYMEIPVHGDGDSPTEIATTPDGKGGDIPMSISKDSLFSPDKQPTKPSIKDISPSAEKNPAMSFTIDLDDHPPRKINIGSSLSQFVPTKIRKNFLERKDKTVATKGNSAESTPSKNSEEREISPNNQRKIEEIWSSLEGKGKPSQLSSVQATAGSSLRSPNLEELEKLSELSADDRRSSEKEGEKKSRKPVSSKGSPQVSRGVKVGSVKPVASVSLSQYSDATTYLIDKMFEGGDGSVCLRRSSSSDKEMSPEQKLYREAASHDKPKTLSSASKLDSSKPPRSSTSKVSGSSGKRLSSSSNKSETKVTSKTKKLVTESKKGDADDDDNDLKIVEKESEKCDDTENEKDDKASEAGTYTIEVDEKEAEEEEQARNRIDEVFGVEEDVLNSSSLWRPIIDPAMRSMASPGGYDNVRDDEVLDNNGDDDEDEIDGDKTPLDEYGASLVDSLMIDEDGNLEDDDDDEDADEDGEDGKPKNRVEDSGTMGTEGVQTWVSQLTALASHKANNISDSAKLAWDDASDTSSVTKKPPHGLSRKRPGTGRKLPSIPTTDRSPVSSEHSSHIGEQDVSGLEDSMSIPSTELLLHNGKDAATANGRLSLSPAKSPQVSSQFSKYSPPKTAATTNGHLVDSPSSSVVGKGGGKGQQNGSSNVSSPNVSARSRGSVDTELLLQDTKTVMAAMEARMANKKQSNNHRVDNYQDDSDTDVSSTVAMVNGDENYKPTMYRSPREALSKRHYSASEASRSIGSNNISSSSAKKSLGKSYTQATASSKSHSASASPRNVSSTSFTTKKSVVSDILSRADSFDNDSIVSDVGSDAGDSTASRSSSKGKGAMSMTKPNRAFQLRRARADSTDEPTTPRSAKSAGKSNVGSARSASLHSTSRVRSSVVDSGRSEASLGAQIARKSRTNEKLDKTRSSGNISSSNLERNDGGRHSLRIQRASSLTIAPQSALTYPGKRETTPKSHLKSTYSSSSKGSLSITGVSSGTRPQSQPGSRSNSPKAAERMAWKRRKEYDPRKAVAEAKAKTKEPGTVSSASSTSSISTRSKPSTRDNLKRRMIRSASFGNSVNLTSHGLDSNSNGLGLPERKDRHNDEGFRRAFMPVHGASSLRSDRSTHSADEDDTISSITSTQGHGRNHVASNNVKSAFTPPLILNKTGNSTSPAPMTVKRRNSLNSTTGSLSLSVAPGLSNMDLDEPCNTPNSPSSPQTSYDNLIVSSIYQLSLKLSTSTDKTLHRLREEDRVTFTPSPIEDFMSDVGKSDFPAWKSANQELAGVLKNLRKLERHVTMMNRVLFPDEDMDSDMLTGREKQKYFQEIERIRSELAGFHPIDNPRREDYEVASPEMEEFSETF